MICTGEVDDYLDGLRGAPDALLREMEAYARRHRVPIAGPETSRLIAMLARAVGARVVLEIGLAIGYTALRVARVLPPDGRVVALERDPAMTVAAAGFLGRDPAGGKVEIVPGDARETLAGLQPSFDLVFVDADKRSYPVYVDLGLQRLRPAGLMVIDNLLMDGRVAVGAGDDHWAQGSVDVALALNRRLADDPGLSFVLLPVGDGVGVVQKE